jgi:hypothetical protein
MPKKELIFFTTIIVLGFLDWLTTITGVVYFGATELNPLIASLTQTNPLAFSAVKLTAITVVAYAFCKAANITAHKSIDWSFTKRFLNMGYLVTFSMLTLVVSSNVLTLSGLN